MNPDILRAAAFAAVAHKDQKRKGKLSLPYIVHPLEVAEILATIGASSYVIEAGLLHDVLEDTETEEETILNEFGPTVLHVVNELTFAPGMTKEQKVAYIRTVGPEAKLVKAADLISNLRSLARDTTAMSPAGLQKFIFYANEMFTVLNPAVPLAMAVLFDQALLQLKEEMQ